MKDLAYKSQEVNLGTFAGVIRNRQCVSDFMCRGNTFLLFYLLRRNVTSLFRHSLFKLLTFDSDSF